MDALQTRFEQWYKENHEKPEQYDNLEAWWWCGQHLSKSVVDGSYTAMHAASAWQGFKGACDCVREHAKAKKGNIELLNTKFEKYWSERYSFELKRGHGCARSLRKVEGMYVATLTQEAWEHYQAFNE